MELKIGDLVTGTQDFFDTFHADKFVAKIVNVTTQFGDFIYYELDKEIKGIDE